MFKKFFYFIILFLMISTIATNSAFAKNKKVEINRLDYVNIEWWKEFQDDNLTEYIIKCVQNNHDGKIAIQKTEDFKQYARISLGKELPQISVAADYLGLHVPQLDNFKLNNNAFILPFTASYEADFLLKNRDKTRSANKSYEVNLLNEKSVYIALASDTAASYFNVLRFDDLVAKQRQIVKNQTEIYKHSLKAKNAGVINQTALNNSEKTLIDAKNELAKLLKNRESALTQLAVLIGESPSNARNLTRTSIYEISLPKNISSLSSNIIDYRPDITACEKEIEKAGIDIRVAKKDFLPTFNITGVWAFNTIAGGSFFSWKSSLAALVAGASQDIFAGGRKIANLRLKKSQYEQALQKFEQTHLVAIKEVNDSLYILNADKKINFETNKKLKNEQDNLQMSKKRYENGVISKPSFYEEINKYINVEKTGNETKTVLLRDYITLYKATGGNLK